MLGAAAAGAAGFGCSFGAGVGLTAAAGFGAGCAVGVCALEATTIGGGKDEFFVGADGAVAATAVAAPAGRGGGRALPEFYFAAIGSAGRGAAAAARVCAAMFGGSGRIWGRAGEAGIAA